MRAVLSTCPFCPCGCGLYVQEEHGALAGVAPSEHHPVSRGRLCARGWAAHEAPSWGERLTEPLARSGGALEPVLWDEALGRAALGLRAARDAGRPVGVLGSARATDEESYLLARLGRGALQTGHLDSALRATYEPLLRGLAEAGATPRGTLDEVEGAEVILLLEGDLARSHPRAAFSVLQAIRRGGRLVTLGPVRTQLARLAALHLDVRPGGENETLTRLAAAAATLAPPEPASPERRPASEAVRRTAAWFARAARAGIVAAPLGAPSRELEEMGGLLAAFLGRTGHLARTGSVLLVLPVRGNLRGACAAGVIPDRLPGARVAGDEDARRRLLGLWGVEPALAAGDDAASLIERVSALVVLADDPPSSLPAGGAARAALARVGFKVVLDAFRTPTAEKADVVLPIAAFGETGGTVTSVEGRVQGVRPVRPPPGLARPGWQVLADLAERLGLPGLRSLEAVEAELGLAVPARRDGGLESSGAGPNPPPPAGDRLPPTGPASPPGGCVLAVDGVFDWTRDPMVEFSPTLRREHVPRRRRFPQGLVEVSADDAQRLGLRPGGSVRLVSSRGEVVLPAVARGDLASGVALVPFAFREPAAGLLDGGWRTEVRLQRA